MAALKSISWILCYLLVAVKCQAVANRPPPTYTTTECADLASLVTSLIYCETSIPFCQKVLGAVGEPVVITQIIIVTSTTTVVQTTSTTITSETTSLLTSTISEWTATSIANWQSCTVVGVSPYFSNSPVPQPRAIRAARPIIAPRLADDCNIPDGTPFEDIYSVCDCFWTGTVTYFSTSTLSITSLATATTTEVTTVTGTIAVPVSTMTLSLPCVPTATACPTPDTNCDNIGLEWSYLPGDGWYPGDGTDPTNIYDPTFDPAYTKDIIPNITGVTDVVGGFSRSWESPSTWTIYGTSLPTEYILLNHRGYFFAPITGVYDFSFDYVDDRAFMWLGSLAYSGWSAANEDLTLYVKNKQPRGFQPSLVGGTYYAFRVHYAQGFGPAGLTIHITAPDGTLIVASNSTYSPYFVEFACDPSLAPPYPPFGQET